MIPLLSQIELQLAKTLAIIRKLPGWKLAAGCGIVLVISFIISLFGSKAGEIAAALGGVIGGLIGAGGAVWAVFLTLSREKNEEEERVAAAIRTEVTTLVKYAIGTIGVCEQIATAGLQIPRQDAGYIVKNIPASPAIYPAVADRVGLLPHPQATVEFYMRLAEARMMVEMLQNKTTPQGIVNVNPPVENVTPQFAGSIAESLITALQLARSIIADDVPSSHKAELTGYVNATVISQIDDCLTSAKQTFPDAESFKTPDVQSGQS